MAVWRLFLMFLTLCGTLLLIMLSFSTLTMSADRRAERIHQRQNLRKHLLRKMCDVEKIRFSAGNQSLKNTSKKMFDNFIVDDNHRLIYCFIPKVACTHWKRVMYVLKQGKPYLDPLSIDPSLVHGTNKLNFLKNLDKKERQAKLKDYTKFLFVRDPFVRLISAFRDKFQYNKENEYFYQNFGKPILKLYANQSDSPETMLEAHESGRLPSFSNFIQYLLDPQTEKTQPFDIHWRQMHRLCHPCLIQYNFIGHQETLQEDAQQLLEMLKLQDDIEFPPSYNNVTTYNSIKDWFRTVSLEERRKLYELYERDFELFGYKKPPELLDG